MKKLLIATTALVATAGVAAAEVAVSGNGRMGVVYNGEDLNFSSRIRVAFTLSGETDGGLSFGGSFRADNAGGAANGSAGEIFISGAFGTIAMGDVVGAAEAVVGDLPEVGYTDLDSFAGDSYGIGDNDITYFSGDSFALTGAGNPVLLYTYTAGDLTFAMSFNDGASPDAQEMALGVKYVLGDYAVALGYEETDVGIAGKTTHLIAGVDATFGDTEVKAFYGMAETGPIDAKQYGLGVTSKFDAITVKGYAKVQDADFFGDVTSYGLGMEYSLGGGATVAAGVADNDLPGSDPVADVGIKFTF
ncbi:MAG TPA: porin [Paracoccaceae bacterium]|nr:porin [Paracoccaceae bacterium]